SLKSVGGGKRFQLSIRGGSGVSEVRGPRRGKEDQRSAGRFAGTRCCRRVEARWWRLGVMEVRRLLSVGARRLPRWWSVFLVQ
ncbi:Hypothetical predicted protein, partial [Xyrichtys novacula]